jgi:hypothetical protein
VIDLLSIKQTFNSSFADHKACQYTSIEQTVYLSIIAIPKILQGHVALKMCSLLGGKYSISNNPCDHNPASGPLVLNLIEFYYRSPTESNRGISLAYTIREKMLIRTQI